MRAGRSMSSDWICLTSRLITDSSWAVISAEAHSTSSRTSSALAESGGRMGQECGAAKDRGPRLVQHDSPAHRRELRLGRQLRAVIVASVVSDRGAGTGSQHRYHGRP